MSVNIKYKGDTISSISTTSTKTLKTSGKYCEADIVIENTQDGGESTERSKPVIFWDYEGTELFSYTYAEALALTELPTYPERTGFTFQEWNCKDLTTFKQYVNLCQTCDGPLDVGAIVIASDGKTRIKMVLDHQPFNNKMRFNFSQSVRSGVKVIIDGTEYTDSSHTGATAFVEHTFDFTNKTFPYEFEIVIEVVDGYYQWFGPFTNARDYRNYVTEIIIGQNFDYAGSQYSLSSFTNMEKINIPQTRTESLTLSQSDFFSYNTNLKHLNIPCNLNFTGTNIFRFNNIIKHISYLHLTDISQGMFSSSGLISVSFPLATTMGTGVFQYCNDLKDVALPSLITGNSNGFSSCQSLEKIKLPNLTTGTSNLFNGDRLLKSLDLPKCTILDGGICSGCFDLTDVNIPLCETLSGSSFYECISLETVDVPNLNTLTGSYIFRLCSALHHFRIPKAVTSIPASLFYQNCVSVEYVDLSDYDTPPSLSGANFAPNATCVFWIKRGTLSLWQNATNWSAYSTRYVEVD